MVLARMAVSMVVVTVAGLYFFLPMLLTPVELVASNCSITEAFTRSWQMARGHRLELFGYSTAGGLVLVVGLFVCCIGLLPAYALQQGLLVTLYLSLRNGMGYPPLEDAV
jgi:hypothetical protein